MKAPAARGAGTRRDPLATHNERVKLLSSFVSALGLGLVGFAVLRPLIREPAEADATLVIWTIAGLAFHLLVHYILRYLEKAQSE